MYKKVSVVLGALALMVALGFGPSQSFADEDEATLVVCHKGKKTITVSVPSSVEHEGHGDNLGAC